MKNPKVSIIIPVYNGADYVGEAIDSALAQTYSNFEVIVVNDGSKDKGATSKICRTYGAKIRYYEKKNGGVASALNMGIKKMMGEYFSWLSHDDLYYLDKIAKEIKLMKSLDKKSLVYSNYEIIDQNGINLGFSHLKSVKKDFVCRLIKEQFIHGCTLLIPRVAFKTAGLFDETLRNTQDYDLWFRFLRKSFKFTLCPNHLVKSRHHDKQTSLTTSQNQLIEQDDLYYRVLQDFKSEELISGQNTGLGYLDMAIYFQKQGFKKAAHLSFGLGLKNRQHISKAAWALLYLRYKFWSSPFQLVYLALVERYRLLKRKTRGTKNKLALKEIVKFCLIGNINSSHNQKVAKHLCSIGYDVHFISFAEGQVEGKIEGIKKYQITRKKFEPKLFWFLRAYFRTKKIINKINPDIVQGQYLSSGGLLAGLSGFHPYTIGILGSDVLEPQPLFLRLFLKKVIRNASEIICSSELLKKAVLSYNISPRKIHIVRFGIDLEQFKPKKVEYLRRALKLQNRKIILSPRFIDRIYHIKEIIQAFEKNAENNYHLLIMNMPYNLKYKKELDLYIRKQNLGGCITFVEKVDYEKMPDYYNLADVVISIPQSEGAGVSVLEAMACQRKIVISDVPVFNEWQEGKNLWRTKIEVSSISRAIKAAMEFPDKKYLPIGRKNRLLVAEKANIRNCLDELDKIYRFILK